MMDLKKGLYLAVTDDSELISTLSCIEPRGMEVKVWCPHRLSQLRKDIENAVLLEDHPTKIAAGDPETEKYFVQWQSYNPVSIVLALKDREKYRNIKEIISKVLPRAKMLTIHLKDSFYDEEHINKDVELVASWADLLLRPVSAELRHLHAAHHLEEVKKILDDGDKIALLLQPDPDPDSLASALALRTLLGRNKKSTPIVSFGTVTRPENIAMMKLLDLEVLTIKPEELEEYDRIVLLDVQPSHFGPKVKLPQIDVIIDHHPIQPTSEARYLDIRPTYGATSSILTEYMKAARMNIGQRLATALLYGIKSDTFHLNRGVIDADLDAYVSLYPEINYNLLRRIEKPQLPMRFAPVLAKALQEMISQEKVLVSCLGEVEREDLIPQIADFLLQFEDAEWVICAGLFQNQVVMSVRNVGYVRSAGDVVKKIVAEKGVGGGHRMMAKMIFTFDQWKEYFGVLNSKNIRETVLRLFVEEVQ